MVSMKTGQFYFKLSVKRIVSMTRMSFGLDNEKVGSKVEVNLELQGRTDKLSRLNAVVDIEETLNEEESKRLESVVEPSSISSSSLPISSDDCSFTQEKILHARRVELVFRKSAILVPARRIQNNLI